MMVEIWFRNINIALENGRIHELDSLIARLELPLDVSNSCMSRKSLVKFSHAVWWVGEGGISYAINEHSHKPITNSILSLCCKTSKLGRIIKSMGPKLQKLKTRYNKQLVVISAPPNKSTTYLSRKEEIKLNSWSMYILPLYQYLISWHFNFVVEIIGGSRNNISL